MILPLLVSLMLGAADAPPTERALEPWEETASKVQAEGVPACEPGHEGALVKGALTIRPKETICVKLRVDGKTVVPDEVVTSNDPENTLVVRMWRDAETDSTFLTLHNPLADYLSYKAAMRMPGDVRSQYTSSCPVLSRRDAIEHWPHEVSELILTQFTAKPESKTIECE